MMKKKRQSWWKKKQKIKIKNYRNRRETHTGDWIKNFKSNCPLSSGYYYCVWQIYFGNSISSSDLRPVVHSFNNVKNLNFVFLHFVSSSPSSCACVSVYFMCLYVYRKYKKFKRFIKKKDFKWENYFYLFFVFLFSKYSLDFLFTHYQTLNSTLSRWVEYFFFFPSLFYIPYAIPSIFFFIFFHGWIYLLWYYWIHFHTICSSCCSTHCLFLLMINWILIWWKLLASDSV